MTIHPFPKSVAGHAMSASLRDEALPVCDGSLAGVVHAIEPSGRAEAIPALFFQTAANADQHQGHGRVPMRDIRSERAKRRNFLFRAEQISRGALVAKRATADLLARAVQLRNSLADVSNDRSITWAKIRAQHREIPAEHWR